MGILCAALQIYVLCILVRIVLSWFPLAPGGAMEGVDIFLRTITEPVLGPMRRAIPPLRAGGMGLDLSPMILLLVVQIFLIPLVC